MKWLESNQIKIDPTKRPKKLTATRLATVLGLNKWSTPFQVWCEVTRTYEPPFEDSKYTLAGKAIEPIIINMLKDKYFMAIKDPTEVYGKDYFKRTYGDFYHDVKVFGGMWDAIGSDRIIEIKTTKRAEDWLEDIPEYYAIQASLYAYLSGIDDVYMVCAFLTEGDYDAPEKFVPTIKNTIIKTFKLSERYPNFESTHIKPALKWWDDHVVSGISPMYDPKKDEEYIKALRHDTAELTTTQEQDLLLEIDALQTKVTEAKALEKELKAKTETLKALLLAKLSDDVDKVDVSTPHYCYTLAKATTVSIDKDRLKEDGLLDKYQVSNTIYKLTNKKLKGEC